MATQQIWSDLWYFFIAFLFLGSWFSCEATIFVSTMEVTSVFVNSLHTWEAHHILLPSFKLCIIIIIIIPRYISWIFSNILSKRGHQIAKLIAVHELTGTIVPYIALREVAHGMVCLSESYWGLNFVTSLVRNAITYAMSCSSDECDFATCDRLHLMLGSLILKYGYCFRFLLVWLQGTPMFCLKGQRYLKEHELNI